MRCAPEELENHMVHVPIPPLEPRPEQGLDTIMAGPVISGSLQLEQAQCPQAHSSPRCTGKQKKELWFKRAEELWEFSPP